ncbi:AAA family ATPase [Pelomyxa schiedti]|nr:AAA family ATPase [Pelomyxa schiedti]
MSSPTGESLLMGPDTRDENTPPLLYRIVLTGGPCGGKTTALSEIAERLRSCGFQVFLIPENSTIFSNAGAGFPVHGTKAHQMCWETSRIRCQMAMEDSFCRIARSSKQATVIVCDRGTVDAAAYMSEERWEELLLMESWTENFLRDSRYDLVVHMVSTAIGATEFYTKSNNTARRETVAEAAELDLRIRQVWGGHPNVVVIDNSTNFNGKIVRVVAQISNHLGLLSPTPTGSWQRYLVSRGAVDAAKATAASAGVSGAKLRITDFIVKYTFLAGSNAQENQCIRMRVHGDSSTYSLARKFLRPSPASSETDAPPSPIPTPAHTESSTTSSSSLHATTGEYVIVERPITVKEYNSLLRQADQSMRPFTRLRRAFVWGDKYYELDENTRKPGGTPDNELVLQVEVSNKSEKVPLPFWIAPHVIKDITDDPNFSLYHMASHNANSH